MSLQQTLISQFEQPHGALGYIAGWVMAHRPSNRERNSWTVSLLDLQVHNHVLEIGCGPGLALTACLARVTNGLVVGLDHSQTMLNLARARNAQAVKDGSLQLRLGSFEQLALTDELFDKIFFVNVVQFLDDKAGVFNALRMKLRPGGRIASTYMPRGQNPSREKALTMADELKRYMETVGFIKIKIEELPLKPVPAVCVIGERP
jgi:ubiquinone/menaquinone biosynthesis C-methylase UbiE